MTALIQRSFAGGELAPSLGARSDVVKYQTGLRTCRNFFVQRHGGIANRAGTRFVAEQASSAARGRLIKFVFNADQTYVLLFENQRMRVVRDGAVLTCGTLAAYNGATAYVPGDKVLSGGTNYYCIANTTGNAPPNATYWYAMPADGTYEIPTPYLSADLDTITYDQSGDIVTLHHGSYAPRELARTGHTTWVLSTITFAPSIAAPTGLANTGAAGAVTSWVVTAIKSETLEESLQSSATSTSATPSSGSPITVSWSAVSGAAEYNVYKALNGVYGFIGTAVGTSFSDNGIAANTAETPPASRNPFSGAGNYPRTGTYYQQRKVFAATSLKPESVEASRSGMFHNFTRSSPIQSDDAVSWSMAGRQVNEIRHMVEVGQLVMLTAGAEWVIQGNASGVLAPGEVNPTPIAYNGASTVMPAIVDNNLIYVQARGTKVRDLRYEVQSTGYAGRDLTVFSAHMFDGYTITRLDYAQVPHSIVWAIRDDGTLLGMTYLREHEIWGWHRHDTGAAGMFEDVCVIPEGTEDAVYVLVRRTIDGATVRYLERFDSRISRWTDFPVEAFFVDCGLTYNGRNETATTMTVSGGTDWTIVEALTLTASASFFTAGDVGNAIVLRYDDEDLTVTLTITGYTSGTVVTVQASRTVPAGVRAVAVSTWSKAVDSLAGLDHLEGETVAILADGSVETPQTVTAGAITLQRPYSVVHVGLPIEADAETLSLDVLNAETLQDKRKLVRSVTLQVESSRGITAGIDSTALQDANYGDPMELFTGAVEVPLSSTWNDNGRVFVRQSDPLPLTILAAIPDVSVGK